MHGMYLVNKTGENQFFCFVYCKVTHLWWIPIFKHKEAFSLNAIISDSMTIGNGYQCSNFDYKNGGTSATLRQSPQTRPQQFHNC
eukprot:3596781-Rhodomonas_salina.1